MLVLTRVEGEVIAIGDNISLRVLTINGNSIRFGVEAPKSIHVHRAEVYERIQNERAKTSER
ncbi:carbon storage regulator CsrA [Pseudomonas sp. NFX15]|uniref:carbon storage regulator CsrA n=1 Tax=Pseudomonas sp. NFX15 TaxID=2816958 RepID=UPI003B8E8EFF